MTVKTQITTPGKVLPILVKQTDVLKMCGIKSNNTLVKRINESGFPAPLKIDGVKFWVYSEVLEWINDRIEQARKAQEAAYSALSN